MSIHPGSFIECEAFQVRARRNNDTFLVFERFTKEEIRITINSLKEDEKTVLYTVISLNDLECVLKKMRLTPETDEKL